MKKLGGLRGTLVSSGLFHLENFEVWVENIELKIRGKFDGNRVLLHTMSYRAVYSIEAFNYEKHPIELLSAKVSAWLSDNDDRGGLDDPEPSFSVDVLDDSTADLEITLQFEEDVYIAESESGDIEYDGRLWALEEREQSIAETGRVVSREG